MTYLLYLRTSSLFTSIVASELPGDQAVLPGRDGPLGPMTSRPGSRRPGGTPSLHGQLQTLEALRSLEASDPGAEVLALDPGVLEEAPATEMASCAVADLAPSHRPGEPDGGQGGRRNTRSILLTVSGLAATACSAWLDQPGSLRWTGPIRYGRIISLSSCSTMWQCQTYCPGLSNFARRRVTSPG
jgi:hypothetical protein